MWESDTLIKKEGISSLKFPLSVVLLDALNSNQFFDDLKKIANLETIFNSEPLSRDFTQKYKRNYKKKSDQNKPLLDIWAEIGFTKYKHR